MLKQLRRDTGQLRGKIIFLSHDYNHLHPEVEKIYSRPIVTSYLHIYSKEANPDLSVKMSPGSEDLAAFLAGAQQQGWVIRTLDTYLRD